MTKFGSMTLRQALRLPTPHFIKWLERNPNRILSMVSPSYSISCNCPLASYLSAATGGHTISVSTVDASDLSSFRRGEPQVGILLPGWMRIFINNEGKSENWNNRTCSQVLTQFLSRIKPTSEPSHAS